MSQPFKKKRMSTLDLVWNYKFHLAFYILCTSVLSFALLYALDIVPDELKVINEQPDVVVADTSAPIPTAASLHPGVQTASAEVPETPELPSRVIISKIGVDTVVHNPNSTNNNVLNDYLLQGAVRYPGSGMLGKGNVFIFGHSTGLRIVNNQAFKTFNGLKNLNPDDQIKVQSADREYLYKVVSVTLVDSDKALVDLSTDKNLLTISTCDVFGQKQQRFVVQAEFVSSYPLTN